MELPDSDQKVRVLGQAFRVNDESAVPGRAPLLGEHTDQLLAELGHQPTDIERQSGIRIKGPEPRDQLPTYAGPPLRAFNTATVSSEPVTLSNWRVILVMPAAGWYTGLT